MTDVELPSVTDEEVALAAESVRRMRAEIAKVVIGQAD